MSKPIKLNIIYHSIDTLEADIEAMKAYMEYSKPVTAEDFIELELTKTRIANREAFPEKWIEAFHQLEIEREIKSFRESPDYYPPPF